MKIAYLLPYVTIVSGSFGGIKMQALQWELALRRLGHEVVEISPWETYDWKSFDVIHFFYFGSSYFSIYNELRKRAPQAKFICSPILDPHFPLFVYKILSRVAFPKAKIYTDFCALRRFGKIFDEFAARTEFEKKILEKAFSIPSDKIQVIPLCSRFKPNESDIPNEKANFCLHVSRISDKTKNVERLVLAALKYDFHLVLAGVSTDEFVAHLKRLSQGSNNIQILGRISDDQLVELYRKSKVFALPSIREGVGLAALEAASYGCDVVITNIGGPKEYFLPNAIAVNPYSIDEIGCAIKSLLDGKTFQPALRKCIANSYSMDEEMKKLLNMYARIG